MSVELVDEFDGDEGTERGGGRRLGMAPKDLGSWSKDLEVLDSFELEDIFDEDLSIASGLFWADLLLDELL